MIHYKLTRFARNNTMWEGKLLTNPLFPSIERPERLDYHKMICKLVNIDIGTRLLDEFELWFNIDIKINDW